MARRPRLDEHASLFPDPTHIDQPPKTSGVSDALKAKALLVHERLCAEYECPIAYFHHLDPLSELVSSLLSHRTRNSQSGAAFKSLVKALPTWQQVIDAPTSQVEALISAANWPELKAPRIQSVLRRVKQIRGELSLEFLGQLDVASGLTWLRQLPGVGPKTAAAVLSFSTLRKAALPVDSHHHRVAERLRLIPGNASLERAHVLLAQQLPNDWNAQQVYDNHEVLMLHGQKCCFPAKPACERCVVENVCPSSRVKAAIA